MGHNVITKNKIRGEEENVFYIGPKPLTLNSTEFLVPQTY